MALFTGHIITSDSALGDAKIQRSLRFNTADADYLNRTIGTPTSSQIFTFSCWLKTTKLDGDGKSIFLAQGSSQNGADQILTLDSDNELFFQGSDSGIYGRWEGNGLLRDTSAWYHIVVKVDTTVGTNGVTFYVNNEVASGTWVTTLPQNKSFSGSANGATHHVGKGLSSYPSQQAFSGYLAEVNFIDGQALDSSYFGFTDPQTGIWFPKRFEGTYGTNGFYLDFSDNTSTTTLGIDKSPNGNDFTLNNFDVNDSVEDTPTNAFCTMNVLDKSAGTQLTATNGNLRVYTSHGFRTMRGTFGVSSGKWYWESRLISWASSFIGVTGGDEDITSTGRGAETSNSATIRQNTGNLRTNAGDASYGNSQSDGDILGFALDMDNGKFYISENGTWYNSGDPANGTNAGKTGLTGTVFPSASPYDGKSCYFNFGQDDTFDGNETSQGNTDGNGHGKFKYAPPTGFLSLCTANLPTATSILRPQRHFDTVIYTGTGSSNSITGLEFSPDLIWAKRRDTGGHHHLWVDTIRGGSKSLMSNSDDSENSNANRDMTFLSNGIRWNSDTGNANANGGTYAVWCWKAGGAAVSNTDGDITSSVSVNREAGFSIVSYTGNGNSTATIGHGLGKAPKWIITKCRSTDTQADWVAWHVALSDNKNVFLNQTNAETTPSYGHITDPTSTLINVTKSSGNQTNASGETYISYCWAEIPGYSKFGSYIGSGNSDGQYIHLGFRPAFVMIKRTNASEGWEIFDNKRDPDNVIEDLLEANTDAASITTVDWLDFLSDGMKHRTHYSNINNDGSTYIYMAFAEQPGITSFDTFPNAR